MLDLELLKTLVSVVDERSFSRAAERVHRTQSTVSQQILKLEGRVGQPLLLRDRTGKDVRPTENGEVLATYARRLLAMAQEAEDALLQPAASPPLRLGVPEDFDALRMSSILAGFMAAHRGARMETVSGMSTDLRRKLDAGEIEMALIKREPGTGEALAAWPERLVWVANGPAPGEPGGCVPLALFPQGCIYRQRAIRALETAGRPWRIAFGSQSLTGIQAAISGGLGISVLPTSALRPEHVVLGRRQGFPALPASELALVAGSLPMSALQRDLAAHLAAEIDAHVRASAPAGRRGRPVRAVPKARHRRTPAR